MTRGPSPAIVTHAITDPGRSTKACTCDSAGLGVYAAKCRVKLEHAASCHAYRYKEYISCGKGRDMGFDSILGYQKKISGGAGDLATSREVHRLGTRLDFFRLMSFYHGGECDQTALWGDAAPHATWCGRTCCLAWMGCIPGLLASGSAVPTVHILRWLGQVSGTSSTATSR